MERAGAIIKRLLEQYELNAGTAELILTAQLLLNELHRNNNANTDIKRNVFITMPSFKFNENTEVNVSTKDEKKESAIDKDKYVFLDPIKVDASEKETVAKTFTKTEDDQIINTPAEFTEEKTIEKKWESQNNNIPKIEDVSTFSYYQKSSSDLNEKISNKEKSLNDRFKAGNKEVGTVLHDAPVKDLKKAIGINDRFVFINELFRDDENMYERSIKTINSFNILPEAEYWIKRELKLKLGWNDDSETVKHFDQLVRRRFS